MSDNPEALRLALRFHELYERLAPDFGYETRAETRVFDPDSKNGRLMVAVCAALAQQAATPRRRPDRQPEPTDLTHYRAILDIWAEANAVDTVLGSRDRLLAKVTRLRDAMGAGVPLEERQAATPAPAEPVAWLATRLWNARETWTCPADIVAELRAAPPATPAPAEPDPRTDDGAALRLAVARGISISFAHGSAPLSEPPPVVAVDAFAGWGTSEREELTGADPYAATRRAIVRAAEARDAAPAPSDVTTAFEEAMRQTWRMIDPLDPPGQPGSYARGEHNGVVAALRTLRDNFAREVARRMPERP